MANLRETQTWENGIYQIEKTDPVVGGADGISNKQAQQLANRTAYLKQQVETKANKTDLTNGLNGKANSSHTHAWGEITGKPSTFAPASHTHTMANITDLAAAMNAKANLASPTFTGSPKAPTPAQTVNDTTIATTAFVKAAIAALVGSAPAALDTLAEIATALGNDGKIKEVLLAEIAKKANASHTHTMANITDLAAAMNAKANLASPTFTGSPKAPTPAQTVNDTTIATTAFVKAAIAALVGSAPEALDTLEELSNALANDANLKKTLLTEIGKKANVNHKHTVGQISDFNQATNQLINDAFSYQKIDKYKIRKFPDGTLILSGKIKNPRDSGRANTTPLVFPVSFIDEDYDIFVSEVFRSNASGNGQYNWAFATVVDKSRANILTWYDGETKWLAIGRWK